MNRTKQALVVKACLRLRFTDFFNTLIEKGEKVTPVEIFGGWFEIDTFEDYRKVLDNG